jgi:hypothetical protein
VKKLIANLLIDRKKLVEFFKQAEDLFRIGNGKEKRRYVISRLVFPAWLKSEIKEIIQEVFEKHSNEINSRTMKEPVRRGRKLA